MSDEKATARDILLRARALAEAGNADAAVKLLVARRDDWPGVPPAYDATIGRHLLRAGDAKNAEYYLTSAADAYHGNMPVEQRRDLAAALFQTGQIEAAGRELSLILQAGGIVARPAYRAAIDAYMHRAGDKLDRPPPTPYRLIAQAEALAETKDFAAAQQLLTAALAQHGAAWGEIPAAFDALMGRVSLRSGDRESAIERLSRARDASGADVSIMIRQPLGTALFEVGRFAEGGRELDLALRGGATIGRAELLIAVNAYRQATGQGEPIDTTFARNLTLVDPDRRLAYVAVAKNACSMLKAGFVLSSRHRDAYLASGQTIHEFCGTLLVGAVPPEAVHGAEYFRFVMLRDPLRRILSGYLDKVVRGGGPKPDPYTNMQVARTVREAQAKLGIPDDPGRSISFEEFVRYLAGAEDVQCDMHWMPQVQLVGNDLGRYSHVGTVERLGETLDLLSSRFGFAAPESLQEHVAEGDRHITKFSETADLPAPYRALPHELAAFADGVPMPELFLIPELADLLRQRYAADVALHETALKATH